MTIGILNSENATENVTSLLQALPDTFDFYTMGQIQSLPSDSLNPGQDSLLNTPWDTFDLTIAFRISGELSAWMVLLLEQPLDYSMYSEVGNVLASRMASQLNASHGWGIQISPPISLTAIQLETLKKQRCLIRKSYGHCTKTGIVPITVLILSGGSEDVGHA